MLTSLERVKKQANDTSVESKIASNEVEICVEWSEINSFTAA